MATTASTLVQQMEAQRKVLEDYKQRYQQMRDENERLLKELQQRERDSVEVTGHLEKQIEKQTKVLETLSQKVVDLQKEKEDDKAKMAETNSKDLEAKEKAWAMKEHELAESTRQMQIELDELKEFKKARAHMKKELEDLQREKETIQQKRDEDKQEMERTIIEVKARLQRDINQKIAEFKKASEENVNNRLDESTKRILAQNRQMADELRLHVQETEELQQIKNRLEEENKRLVREVELGSMNEQEYAKRGAKQQRHNRELETKVKNLERSLTHVVREFEKERERLASRSKQELDEAQLEIQGLRKLVKVKNRELKLVRKLGQEILDQRTEVEQFFLDALSQVKEQIKRKKDEDHKRFVQEYHKQINQATMRKDVKFPTIRRLQDMHPRHDPSSLLSSAKKLDLRELSWEDREQVLRILFARINNSQINSLRTLPKHTLRKQELDAALSAHDEGDEVDDDDDYFDEDVHGNSFVTQYEEPPPDLQYQQHNQHPPPHAEGSVSMRQPNIA
eukprot:Rmarinus@m.18301